MESACRRPGLNYFPAQNETFSTAHVQASPRFEISHQTTKKRKATKTAWRDYIHFVKPLLDVFSPHFSSFFFFSKSDKKYANWECVRETLPLAPPWDQEVTLKWKVKASGSE